MQQTGISIDERGYFSVQGELFVPMGVNYWPASCGVEMWQAWPVAEMQHDLDLIRELGLNSIRFFLRWQDFELAPGLYDETMFQRLADFLGWCRERGVYAQPSLFVGWMSGGTFWPEWKAGRNLFADPCMVERAAAFAEHAAAVCAPFHNQLLGLDFGNEMNCLADSKTATTDQIMLWCSTVGTAIRRAYPDALLIAGSDHQQVVGDTGWPMDRLPGVNYLSMHAYPVPLWNPASFDGMTDPVCQSMLPFYTRVAREFGPVFVQEFGTIITGGVAPQDAYLRAVLNGCWESGVNGFLWWCLRDIPANIHPYVAHNMESTLGLVTADDQVKPGLAYYLEFARSLPTRALPESDPNAIGLYWPQYFYQRDNPRNPGNQPWNLAKAMHMAFSTLTSMGYSVRIIRGGQPIDPALKQLFIINAQLVPDEVAEVDRWVQVGGQLYWHGPNSFSWGASYTQLLGAKPIDYRRVMPITVEANGEQWGFRAYPANLRYELEPTTARVVLRDADNVPVLLAHARGNGSVVYATVLVEESIEAERTRQARDRWQAWYRMVMEGIGVSV